jgi:hypothetical protein
MSGKLRHGLLVAATYLFGLVLAGAAYKTSRGSDGDYDLLRNLFAPCGLVYAALMLLTFKSRGTYHSLGHLAAYLLLVSFGAGYDSHLEELGGLIVWFIVLATVGVVGFGALVLALVRMRSRPAQSLQDSKQPPA